ncbi:MAG: phage tail family protein [Prevotella sp.]|nr:phage tail family protein [Prevotella sp.]
MHKLILSSNGEQVELYGGKGIRIVKISGISFENTVSTSDMYGSDGSRFQSGRLKERNISLIVRYIGSAWKHEAYKNRLMKILGHKDTVRIRYITDNIDYYIDGYAENIDTPPNVRPMVTQISFVCPDPYWRVSGENSVILAGAGYCRYVRVAGMDGQTFGGGRV